MELVSRVDQRPLEEKMLRNESGKPTGLGKWLVALYEETDGFQIEGVREKLAREVEEMRSGVVEKMWGEVSEGSQGEDGYVGVLGKVEKLGRLREESGRVDYRTLRNVTGAVERSLGDIGGYYVGNEVLRNLLSAEAWENFAKDVLALGLVLRKKVGEEKVWLGDYLFDLGMLEEVVKVNNRYLQDSRDGWGGMFVEQDERMGPSARLTAYGWAADGLAKRMVEKLFKSDKRYYWNKERGGAYSDDMVAKVVGKLGLGYLAGVGHGGSEFNAMAFDRVQLALRRLKPEIEKTRRVVKGEVVDPTVEIRGQVDQALEKVKTSLEENKALQERLRRKLEVAVRKGEVLGGQKEKLEAVKARLGEVAKKVEGVVEAGRRRALLLEGLEAEDEKAVLRIVEMLGLEEKSFSSVEDYSLLVDNWEGLEGVYGMDGDVLDEERKAISSLVDAVRNKVPFDSVKGVLEGQLNKVVEKIGDDKLNEGRGRLDSLRGSVEEIKLDPELEKEAKRVLDEVKGV